MLNHIEDLVKNRRSVRTYDGRALSVQDKEKLYSYMQNIENPYGIGVELRFLDAKEHGLKCPVVSGTELYAGGKIKRVPFAYEAFGYSFESFVLYAQSLGVGTVWLGGTMNRGAYEQAMELGEDEMMPCACALGYAAEKMSFRESMMRKGIKADERLPFEELFFCDSFDTPLSEEAAGKYADLLQMVRLAPSAVNKQPWRVLVTENAVHFYLKRNRSLGNGATLDMQKIDMGIALCHFDLAAKESGMIMTFSQKEPEGLSKTDMEYIASFLLESDTKG